MSLLYLPRRSRKSRLLPTQLLLRFSPMRRVPVHSQDVPLSPRRGQITGRQFKHLTSSLKSFAGRLSISILVLLICSLFLLSRIRENRQFANSQIDVNKLWANSPSNGWIQSSAPRSNWESLPTATNGYLLVRCNGGLNQQRSAICNAVLAARIMNATLVLPELDANFYWHDKSGFSGIYDVDHFIKTLKDDIEIVRSVPPFTMVNGKRKKLKPVQIRPPRDAPPSWYEEVAHGKMKQQGAVYLTPFSHRLAEEIDNDEYQRLRCRVNFHALRFNEDVMKLSNVIVQRLRSEGHFMAIHLRFEMDMLAFAGCLAIFNPEEQEILQKYRKENFAEKRLEYTERRLIGKCPLTPEEVGLLLRAMGFDNSTRIYIAAGDIFGGEKFMQPLRAMFPRLVNRSSIVTSKELEFVNAEGKGLRGSAIDYMVCLLADIFMPTYDGPSNFANNLIGHRLYYGLRTTIQPNRKALAPIFMDREEGNARNFEARIRMVMQNMPFGAPHPRIRPESFYTNPWPECFCSTSSESPPKDKCPASSVTANFEQFELAEKQEQSGEQNNISEVVLVDGLKAAQKSLDKTQQWGDR